MSFQLLSQRLPCRFMIIKLLELMKVNIKYIARYTERIKTTVNEHKATEQNYIVRFTIFS